MNLFQQLEREQMNALRGGRKLPPFRPGDTLKVNVKVVDVTYDEKAKQNKTRERLQAFEGVCIARQGAGLNESFTVRKISYGEGVERVFPLYQPLVDSVEVVRQRQGPPRQALLSARTHAASPPASASVSAAMTIPRKRPPPPLLPPADLRFRAKRNDSETVSGHLPLGGPLGGSSRICSNRY